MITSLQRQLTFLVESRRTESASQPSISGAHRFDYVNSPRPEYTFNTFSLSFLINKKNYFPIF
jgi:hypothetical protein